MEFRWTLASRTGETYTGEDSFPKPEMKDNAATFTLELGYDGTIRAPYGMDIRGRRITIEVPEEHRLVFKRSVEMDLVGERFGAPRYEYRIAFQRL